MTQRLLARGCMLVVAAACFVPAVSGMDDDDPVARFLARTDPPVTTYRALRRLEARNERFNKAGWMEAWTELDPVHGFRYEVAGTGGSGAVLNKVLRPALEGEREAIAGNAPHRSALSLDNYAFTLVERSPEMDTLRIMPRRKDRMLLDGRILVGAADGDLLSVEGRLSRNPSFWTTRVDVVRRYGRIQGMRVPLSMESVASVRIAGRSTFSMTYSYASINGIAVGTPELQGAPATMTRAEDR